MFYSGDTAIERFLPGVLSRLAAHDSSMRVEAIAANHWLHRNLHRGPTIHVSQAA